MDIEGAFILAAALSLACNGQSTVKFDTTSPYCRGAENYVITKVTELAQKVQQLERELQVEKDERSVLEKKFKREAQRLEALANRPSPSKIRVKYTVENLIYGDNFEASLDLEVSQTFFINIMRQAAEMKSVFNFTSTEYAEYGEYITSINELYTNNDAHTYWAFIRRYDTSQQDCLLNVGVSFYIPAPSEHIVLQYRSWDDSLAGCDGPHMK